VLAAAPLPTAGPRFPIVESKLFGKPQQGRAAEVDASRIVTGKTKVEGVAGALVTTVLGLGQ
jgi:hypothetical protein